MEIELEVATDVRFNEPGTRLIVSQYDGKIFKIDLTWNGKSTVQPKGQNKPQ